MWVFKSFTYKDCCMTLLNSNIRRRGGKTTTRQITLKGERERLQKILRRLWYYYYHHYSYSYLYKLREGEEDRHAFFVFFLLFPSGPDSMGLLWMFSLLLLLLLTPPLDPGPDRHEEEARP